MRSGCLLIFNKNFIICFLDIYEWMSRHWNFGLHFRRYKVAKFYRWLIEAEWLSGLMRHILDLKIPGSNPGISISFLPTSFAPPSSIYIINSNKHHAKLFYAGCCISYYSTAILLSHHVIFMCAYLVFLCFFKYFSVEIKTTLMSFCKLLCDINRESLL